ncbi:MAG: dTMP kinase, partial [Gammaproteobacteria bacterium]|nr:dTMP kinase [Gammaproteobacteria bacterium]
TNTPFDHTTELLLIFAARADHIASTIKPALADGQWVVCDRFTDATYAYQGGGRGIDAGLIKNFEDVVQKDLRPDFTILLDAPVEVGIARANERGAPDRFEKEDADFFERVRDTYLKRAKAEPDRFIVVDASRSLQDVTADIEKAVNKVLNA